MYSITDLVNMALKQIKVREIVSLDDETVEAQSAKQTLRITLENLLNKADWRFAKVRKELPLIDKSIIDTAYTTNEVMNGNIFLYPEDVVRIRDVVDEYGQKADYDLLTVKIKNADKFMLVIASRHERLEFVYTRYCSEVHMWTPPFQRAFIHYFAYNMAMYSSMGDAQATQYQLYNIAVKEAMASNTNENKHHLTCDIGVLRARDY